MEEWVYTTSGSPALALPGIGITVTFWTARTGGTQYTDLASAVDGSGPRSSVTTADGTGADPPGAIPVFYGPDSVAAMWAAVGTNPRALMLAKEALALLSGSSTFTGPKTFGPTGNTNDNRILVYAEATGQVGDLLAAYSGTDTGEGSARQRTTYLNEKGELRVIAAKANSVAVRFKGQPTQTAHVLEQTDTGNNPISWWEPNGSWRAPNLGHLLVLSLVGNLTVGVGKHRVYNDTGVPLTIRAVRASVGTAPTGAAIRVDVNKNGTTIFTTQANRPNIAVSTFTSKVTTMDVTSLADGDYLTVDVDIIGSTVAGADLTVQVLCY